MNKIIRIHNWLLMNNFRIDWFNKHLKPNLLSITTWFIYPEFRKPTKIRSVISRYKYLIAFITLFILWTSGFFSIGRWLSYIEKKKEISTLQYKLNEKDNILYYTNDLLCRKDSTISQLRTQMGSREYLHYVIKRDCHIVHYDQLTKLSDEVFFTMIDECEKYQIPYTIFFRVIDHESGFQFIPNNQGSGAFGYCQVMPLTFQIVSRKLGLSSHNEVNNIKTGAYVLHNNYNFYRSKGFSDKDSWLKALTDYSGGDSILALNEIKYYQ